MKEERDEMVSAGCDGFIPKPIDTHEFTNTIAQSLQRNEQGGAQ
jgi:hypothetical protein